MTATSQASPTSVVTARKIELYEPAMCCSTGVCGPSADEQLLTVRDDVRWLEGQGASVERHNLSSDPDAFVSNSKVTGLMHALGDAALPALVADGEILVHGRYPSRAELAELVGATALTLPVAPASSCGCGPGSSC